MSWADQTLSLNEAKINIPIHVNLLGAAHTGCGHQFSPCCKWKCGSPDARV